MTADSFLATLACDFPNPDTCRSRTSAPGSSAEVGVPIVTDFSRPQTKCSHAQQSRPEFDKLVELKLPNSLAGSNNFSMMKNDLSYFFISPIGMSHRVIQHQHIVQGWFQNIHKRQVCGMRQVERAPRVVSEGEIKTMGEALGQALGAVVGTPFQALHGTDLAAQIDKPNLDSLELDRCHSGFEFQKNQVANGHGVSLVLSRIG
jgi:hypothetical protein